MNICTYDKQSYAITERIITDEGFLRVPGHVSRTGIQEYLGSELGFNHDRIMRVYRPPSEVFDSESLASFAGSDVTIEHPAELVNSVNYKSTSAGTVTTAVKDGDFVRCDLIVKDQKAIDAILAGKVELSVGYTATYKDKAGVTPNGEPYDLMQTCIRVNHVALVDNARAGPEAKIFDSSPTTTGATKMAVNIVLDSGRSIDVADAANAQLVADAFDRLAKRTKDAEEEREKMEAAKDAAEEELEEEKKKSSDSAIQARVKAIAETATAAKRIAGKSFACDSVDVTTIQRAALAAKFPKRAWADKSAVYVQAAFDAECEKEAEDSDEEEEENKASKDSYAQLSKDAASNVATQDAAPILSRAQEALNKRTGKGAKK